jgi:DNA-binding protein HU-beta
MRKEDIINEVARVCGLSKKHTRVIVEEVFESLIHTLKRGERIALRGFGGFRLRQQAARRGRNPKPAPRSIFLPGRALWPASNAPVVLETLPGFTARTLLLQRCV